MRRTVPALAVGLFVGTCVTLAVGAVVYGYGAVGGLGFWAYVFGAAAGTVAFIGALAVSNRGRRGAALYSLALTLALIGLATIWWNAMWGFPALTSPEGMWLWPLMVLSGVGAAMALLAARKAA